MGYKHSSQEILDAATRVAAREGLTALSFRLVAEEAGVSDRIVVYYFPDKARLVRDVLGRVGDELQAMLDRAWGADHAARLSRCDILAGARRVLTDPANDWLIRLFIEAIGLAVAGTTPYASVGPGILAGWVDWLGALGENDVGENGEAVATVATIDGLLIAGALLGPAAAAEGWDAVIADARRAGCRGQRIS